MRYDKRPFIPVVRYAWDFVMSGYNAEASGPGDKAWFAEPDGCNQNTEIQK